MSIVPKIISIGNTCLDIILRYTNRLPEWGTELFLKEADWRLGGQGANFAIACCSLGHRSFLVTNVGSDKAGQRLKTQLKSIKLLNASFLQTTSGGTGFTVSLLRRDGERAFLTFLGHQALFSTKSFVEQIAQQVDYEDIVHISGYYMLPRLKTELPALLQTLRAKGVRTSFDPGWPPFAFSKLERKNLNDILPWIDFFEPNDTELFAMTGKTKIATAVRVIRRRFNGVLVLKRGKKGCTIFSGKEQLLAKACPTRVLDTTGAGDVFDAGFLTGIIQGDSISICALRGNSAAAKFVSKGAEGLSNAFA